MSFSRCWFESNTTKLEKSIGELSCFVFCFSKKDVIEAIALTESTARLRYVKRCQICLRKWFKWINYYQKWINYWDLLRKTIESKFLSWNSRYKTTSLHTYRHQYSNTLIHTGLLYNIDAMSIVLQKLVINSPLWLIWSKQLDIVWRKTLGIYKKYKNRDFHMAVTQYIGWHKKWFLFEHSKPCFKGKQIRMLYIKINLK